VLNLTQIFQLCRNQLRYNFAAISLLKNGSTPFNFSHEALIKLAFLYERLLLYTFIVKR